MTTPVRWELLAGLTDQQREAVLATTRPRQFRARDVLFLEGEPGDTLHFVVSGRVAVRALTPSGENATFALMGPGQALGEMALLRKSMTRSASAYALEDVRTQALHRDDFFRLCDAQPAVERVLVSVLAARVDRLSHHLMDALYRSVEERVARRLLETVRLYPDAGDGLVLPLTQQDIASLAGTTRPTANIVLNDLQALGIVALSRGKVVIRDLRKLAAHAGS
ncbi:MAG TPA: Crp/Fnr family transcriptional regulator [Mycobacteriales bacterium]|nr:Crp/Fnr family transcriptional regulator [Mycobacteriales bacterium]